MKNILKHPATNAVCLGLFTAFYGVIFITASQNSRFKSLLYYSGAKQGMNPFWEGWSKFLANGYHAIIAYVLIALAVVVIALLILRRHPYDEYHTSLLVQCLAVAAVLTLIAIAIFYLMILCDPAGIIEKFTLFIAVHWVSIVMCDLTYVLLCRWR